MKIADHEISKVCTEQDQVKYLRIATEPIGYAKLCCYAIKKLRDKEITTGYENICVALWKMFPKAPRFQLSGFEDFPDTDFMEKLIKLRSTPKNQGYLIGGNFQGKTSQFGSPWNLTRKGQAYAKEVEEIFIGIVEAPSKKNSKPKSEMTLGTINYETAFKPIWKSRLYQQFQEEQHELNVDAPSICAAVDMFYSSDTLKKDFQERYQFYMRNIESAKKDGISNNKIEQTKKFLEWLKHKVVSVA